MGINPLANPVKLIGARPFFFEDTGGVQLPESKKAAARIGLVKGPLYKEAYDGGGGQVGALHVPKLPKTAVKDFLTQMLTL